WSPLVIARLALGSPPRDGVLHDALADKAFCQALLGLIGTRRGLKGGRGRLLGAHTAMLRRLHPSGSPAPDPLVGKPGQNNSAIVYGEKLRLKLYRGLEAGIHPDLEIGRFLTAQKFPHSPALAGALEYVNRDDE